MGRFYTTADPKFVEDIIMKPNYDSLMKALVNKQTQYDNVQGVADKLLDIDFNHLDTDEEYENAKRIKDYYHDKINDITDKLANDPMNYKKYNSQLKAIKDEMSKDMKEGNIAKLQASYNAKAKWEKDNAEILKDNPNLYNALRSEAMKNWGGNSIRKIWQQENGLKKWDRDAIEKNIQQLKADLKKSAIATTNGTYIVKDGESVKELTEQDIQNYAVHRILSDEAITGYMKQTDRVGLTHNYLPNGMLNPQGEFATYLKGLNSYAYSEKERTRDIEADPYGLAKVNFGYQLRLASLKAKDEYEKGKAVRHTLVLPAKGYDEDSSKEVKTDQMKSILTTPKEDLTPLEREMRKNFVKDMAKTLLGKKNNKGMINYEMKERNFEAICRYLKMTPKEVEEKYFNVEDVNSLNQEDKDAYNRISSAFESYVDLGLRGLKVDLSKTKQNDDGTYNYNGNKISQEQVDMIRESFNVAKIDYMNQKLYYGKVGFGDYLKKVMEEKGFKNEEEAYDYVKYKENYSNIPFDKYPEIDTNGGLSFVNNNIFQAAGDILGKNNVQDILQKSIDNWAFNNPYKNIVINYRYEMLDPKNKYDQYILPTIIHFVRNTIQTELSTLNAKGDKTVADNSEEGNLSSVLSILDDPSSYVVGVDFTNNQGIIIKSDAGSFDEGTSYRFRIPQQQMEALSKYNREMYNLPNYMPFQGSKFNNTLVYQYSSNISQQIENSLNLNSSEKASFDIFGRKFDYTIQKDTKGDTYVNVEVGDKDLGMLSFAIPYNNNPKELYNKIEKLVNTVIEANSKKEQKSNKE